jgi:hypothetical protein
MAEGVPQKGRNAVRGTRALGPFEPDEAIAVPTQEPFRPLMDLFEMAPPKPNMQKRTS